MKHFRILGLALLALFALSAVASSVATAEEGVLAPEPFTISGGKAKRKNLNNEIVECQKPRAPANS